MADVTKRGAREEEMKKSGKGNRKEGEEGQWTSEESCTLIYVAGYISESRKGRKTQRTIEESEGRKGSSFSNADKRERGEKSGRKMRSKEVRGRGNEGRKPRNNWRSGGGRISCCLASAPFKESLAFC